jgi:tRNA1Val (adenine37-N6)-methyltransferase
MSNNYFQFKQFIIQQEHCAMKVTTDACLFGSLIPTFSKGEGVKNVLDIGTGTGLLSLMLAQKNNDCLIDAIEIDEQAATQAASNFQQSNWSERLKIFNFSAQQFQSNKKYDFIISNPPFFDNDLKSPDAKRNAALHSSELTLEELLNVIQHHLSDNGFFAILLPYHRSEYFENLAIKNDFFLQEQVLVKQTPKHNYFRSMLLFSKQKTSIQTKEIIIKNESNEYSNEFIELLKDYYLHL